jgi:hypothetical protein
VVGVLIGVRVTENLKIGFRDARMQPAPCGILAGFDDHIVHPPEELEGFQENSPVHVDNVVAAHGGKST